MKFNTRLQLSAWLSAALLSTAAACSDPAAEMETRSETGMVTLSLQIQNQSVSTKADGPDDAVPHIGEGSKIDELIFAVYSKTSAGTYEISAKHTAGTVKADGYQIDPVGSNGAQMKIDLSEPLTGGGAALTLHLPVASGLSYKLVCWAQNSQTKAFDTDDLTAVQVKYENATNNDELRDAFCASADFNSQTSGLKVILRRPFAQINVGAAGWDYEACAILEPNPVTYTESTITLSGVAQYYDVLEGKTLVDEQHPLLKDNEAVTFSYAALPAFFNYAEAQDIAPAPAENEEYLEIDLDGKDGVSDYVGWADAKKWYADPETTGNPYTETFKYLSMCYVLVPEGKKNPEEVENVSYGAVLDNVSFSVRRKDDDVSTEYKVFEISNVPVQKNWRTNIVGSDLFLVRTGFNLYVIPDYCGDYNGGMAGDTWHNVEKDENGQWVLHYPAGDPNSDPDFRDPGKDYYPKDYYPEAGSQNPEN